jgi:hypothetical protein
MHLIQYPTNIYAGVSVLLLSFPSSTSIFHLFMFLYVSHNLICKHYTWYQWYYLTILWFRRYKINHNSSTSFINTITKTSVTSGARRDADENCALLEYNAASSGNPFPTFREKVSVPSWRGKKCWTSWPSEMGPILCPETSVKDYHSTLRYGLHGPWIWDQYVVPKHR